MGGKRLTIDFGQLEYALSDSSRDVHEYYLDMATGEIHMIPQEVMAAVEDDDESELADWEQEIAPIARAVKAKDRRYQHIPEGDAHEAWQVMSDFVGTVDDERAQESLGGAIEGPGAFGRFKTILRRHPHIQKRWIEFESARARERALTWLESIGVVGVPDESADDGRNFEGDEDTTDEGLPGDDGDDDLGGGDEDEDDLDELGGDEELKGIIELDAPDTGGGAAKTGKDKDTEEPVEDDLGDEEDEEDDEEEEDDEL